MTKPRLDESALDRAAAALDSAEALVISAGAGVSVDGGVPELRHRDAFARAYPVYAKAGLDYETVANPKFFRQEPELAWGFHGHRLMLYRRAQPHRGYAILRALTARMSLGAYVFTTTVDGLFYKAGFDESRVCEVHGTMQWMQCVGRCGAGLFPGDTFDVLVEPTRMRALPPMPACPACADLARPNILMTGDFDWIPTFAEDQQKKLATWLVQARGRRTVVLELGAGSTVPTVRHFSERIASNPGTTLVRINPREPQVPRGHVSVAGGALQVLEALNDRLR